MKVEINQTINPEMVTLYSRRTGEFIDEIPAGKVKELQHLSGGGISGYTQADQQNLTGSPIEGGKEWEMKSEKVQKCLSILVSCEESQTICKAFRALGHEAYSNDLLPCSGGHPEWHLQMDTFEAINTKDHWDLIVAHPPCTHLAVSGARWFTEGRKPLYLKYEALAFAGKLMYTIRGKANHGALENPISVISTFYRKPDQIIQPWQFGHPERKATCLWLHNLPTLKETANVYDYMLTLPKAQQSRIHYLGGGKSQERSITYPGIARAMAEQWSEYILKLNER